MKGFSIKPACQPGRSAGISLTELMIAVALISVGVLAFIYTYSYISTSIQNSKFHTLSNNLAQEQIEKLKNLSYYSLLVTTSTTSDNRFNPPLAYDTANYPVQATMQGGIPFARATHVDFAFQNGTTITLAPPTSADTGLKEITVYVMWQDANGWHYQEMHNLMANPAANPLNATFTGTVKDPSNNPIAGVLVQVLDNTNWFGLADGGGAYRFSVSAGSYTLQASKSGYFSASSNQSINTGQTDTVNFSLTPMSSGTVVGNVYLDDHLVISRVVVSTGTNNYIEYVELYNPTAASIYIGDDLHNGDGGNPMPAYVPVFWGNNNVNYTARHMKFMSGNTPSSIPSHGYYLMSNTGNPNPATTCANVTVAGTSVSPDACWKYVPSSSGSPQHALECGGSGSCANIANDAGGFTLLQSGGVNTSYVLVPSWKSYVVDNIGWNQKSGGLGNAAPSNAVEGTAITPVGNNGLLAGEELTRYSYAGNVNPSYGNAYDSNDNSHDLQDALLLSAVPRNSATILTPLTGTPATGAYITFNDPLSNTATCGDTTLSGGYRVCSFAVPGIATGTWIMAVSSNSYYVEVTSVTVQANVSTGVPNGMTSPAWTVAGDTWTLLNNTTNYAFISGVVTDINNNPLQGIQVTGGGKTAQTGSNGRYFLSASSGGVLVVANNNNQNKAYSSQSSQLLGLAAGVIYDHPIGVSPSTWFQLSLAGILKGYFQTGSSTPLPGRTAVALSGGNQVAQAVSDNTGYFYLTNLDTGTYTVNPALDPAESASPTSVTVTLASTGTATSVSTFTIINGLAQITGQATSSSRPITTGVLAMASTSTLSGGSTSPPPSISGATGPLCAPCYYAASSDSTGQYTLNVRSSATPYQLYGWYTTYNGASPSFTRKGPYSLNVSTAGATVSQNIAW